ncbi:MAG: flagellar basal body P-ring formation chaperone FlgA [Sulfurimonas sp.]|nr:flagellar basal body P-ring formation chaperone FlgA [Sulfurimonas sp.]
MLIKFLILILISLNANAQNTLNKIYYVDSKTINLSSIIPDARNDTKLFKIDDSDYSKRIKTKDLLKILKKHGYSDYKSKNSYTNFILKSPIDTSKIELALKNYYEKEYDEIEIRSIVVQPRSYTTSLPDKYTVNMRRKDYLQNSGVINIKTPQNKKIFFNYYIDAVVSVYVSRKKIKKDVELSAINSSKKSIILDKFRARPIQNIEKGSMQSKHNIRKNKILTRRDVEELSVIRQNSFINVSIYSDNMAITFSAKALQDGKVNDTIRVEKSNGERLKVKVVGKNRAEIR